MLRSRQWRLQSDRQRGGRPGRAEVACQGGAGSAQRALRPLGRRARSAQTTGAFRRERRLRAALRPRPRATCLAYGVDLNLAQLVFVNTAASVLSSLIPTPGGIGAAEASLSAGLIAMGIDKPDRLCDCDHTAPLDLLPASDLGIRVAAL